MLWGIEAISVDGDIYLRNHLFDWAYVKCFSRVGLVKLAGGEYFLLGDSRRDVGEIDLVIFMQVNKHIYLVETKAIAVVSNLKLEVAPQQLINLPGVDLLVESAAVIGH